jgi:hypothetical protein
MTAFAVLTLLALLNQAPAPPPLRIVVLAGEDAVNIVQQKTAVRPLVEVRDRNNLPVAGATVTFTIGGGQPAAFAGGVQTLTVTTNAAGQAAASGLNALSSGAIQIQVQAAYQGQIATAAISQTNFATAAAAAQAGATGTTGGTSAGAGGGGGISGTTIGVVGGVVAAGAVAATKLTGAEDEGRSFNGSISGQMAVAVTTTADRFVGNCTTTYTVTGTISMTLRDDDAVGSAEVEGMRNYVSNTPAAQCPAPPVTTLPFHFNADVSGGPSNLVFRATNNFTSPVPDGGTGTGSETISFTGALQGEAISGTLVYETRAQSTGSVNSQGIPYTTVLAGSTTIAVTVR